MRCAATRQQMSTTRATMLSEDVFPTPNKYFWSADSNLSLQDFLKKVRMHGEQSNFRFWSSLLSSDRPWSRTMAQNLWVVFDPMEVNLILHSGFGSLVPNLQKRIPGLKRQWRKQPNFVSVRPLLCECFWYASLVEEVSEKVENVKVGMRGGV